MINHPDYQDGLLFLDMSYLNIEIKAKCGNPDLIRKFLRENNAEFKGTDHQVDTYFIVSNGRLKLREGNIENNLIYYERDDKPGPKDSNFYLVKLTDANELKNIFSRSLGVKIVVKKQREIWFIGNVKFHIDELAGLGSFVEIEASNVYADVTKEKLQKQCDFYMREFGINIEGLVSNSYSDMLMKKEFI